jgi:hypothetical protein
MSVVLQQFVVGVLVIACALFAAWRLASARMRLAALEALGALPLVRNAAWLGTLRRRTLQGLGRGCSGCAPGALPAAGRRPSNPDTGHPGRT